MTPVRRLMASSRRRGEVTAFLISVLALVLMVTPVFAADPVFLHAAGSLRTALTLSLIHISEPTRPY